MPSAQPKATVPRPKTYFGPGRTLAWSGARLRLARARNYWLGTTRRDGSPHCRPVWGLWLDEAFYFDNASRISANIRANRRVTVHLEDGDRVVIVEGVAKRVTDRATLGRFARIFSRKYDWDMPETGYGAVFVVRPRVAFAWNEMLARATRWTFPGR